MCQYLELVEMGQLTKYKEAQAVRAVAVANWLQFNKVNFEFSLNFAIFGNFSLRLDLLLVLSIATYSLIFFYFYYIFMLTSWSLAQPRFFSAFSPLVLKRVSSHLRPSSKPSPVVAQEGCTYQLRWRILLRPSASVSSVGFMAYWRS